MKILKDEDFLREKIPMTKFHIRSENFFRLNLSQGDKFLDIGVGTGSVSVQAALLGAEVVGIEQNEDDLSLCRRNAQRHKVSLDLIEGSAPEDLPDRIFDKIFIGGASKVLPEVLIYTKTHLREGGIVVANFILTSSLELFLRELKSMNFKNIEAGLRQSANMSDNGLWKGENPIYIVSAKNY